MTNDHLSVASIDIAAPVEAVWEALTRPELVRRYFHGTELVTDWRVGSPVYWRGKWNGESYEDKGVVLALEPGKLLKVTHWSPMGGTEDAPENYHVVTYELTKVDAATRVVVTQSNNSTPEAAESMAEHGWTPILQGLKAVVEGRVTTST